MSEEKKLPTSERPLEENSPPIPESLRKRKYPPGPYAPRAGKSPQRHLQLREAQKLSFHYCLHEGQLRQFVRKVRKLDSPDWIESLIGLLERRVDNVVFRLGFARSIAAARHLLTHGHILVNGVLHTTTSRILQVGDTVGLTEKALQLRVVQTSLHSPRLPLPSYLRFQDSETRGQGVLCGIPDSSHFPFHLDKAHLEAHYAQSTGENP